MTLDIKPLILLVVLGIAHCEAKTPKWLRILIAISGITSNVSEVQGGDEVPEGEIVVEDIATGVIRELETENAYRSPIFSPGDSLVFALKGDTVVAIHAIGNATPRPLFAKYGLLKLVGVEGAGKKRILALCQTNNGPEPILFTDSGKGTPIVIPQEDDSLGNAMIGSLSSWSRQYGDTLIHPIERAVDVSGPAPRPWGVEIRVKGKPLKRAKELSPDFHFTQPSLSHSRSRLAMVRTAL